MWTSPHERRPAINIRTLGRVSEAERERQTRPEARRDRRWVAALSRNDGSGVRAKRPANNGRKYRHLSRRSDSAQGNARLPEGTTQRGMRPTRFELATFGLKDRRSLGPRRDPLTTELRALDGER